MTQVQTIVDRFEYSIAYSTYRRHKLRYGLFKKITKHALPLFFKGGDVISINPLVNGVYEPEIKALIDYLANHGHQDFLIDIGANIGLTSCQSGAKFSEVHLFEPNPNALGILKINANIALRRHNYTIHEYALGEKQERLKLYVPYDNWGGAFIDSAQNDYELNLHSQNNGFGAFDAANYDIFDVQVESAQDKLMQLFNELSVKNKKHGVVKIDAEGYEDFIIQALLQSLPADFKLFIVYENWNNKQFSLKSKPGLSLRVFNLFEKRFIFKNAPRWLNSMLISLQGHIKTTLVPLEGPLFPGTFVIQVESQA